MAQNQVIMAFRKRLKNRGYTGIKIEKLPPDPEKPFDFYLVRALEPLAGMGVQIEMTLVDMYHAFK